MATAAGVLLGTPEETRGIAAAATSCTSQQGAAATADDEARVLQSAVAEQHTQQSVQQLQQEQAVKEPPLLQHNFQTEDQQQKGQQHREKIEVPATSGQQQHEKLEGASMKPSLADPPARAASATVAPQSPAPVPAMAAEAPAAVRGARGGEAAAAAPEASAAAAAVVPAEARTSTAAAAPPPAGKKAPETDVAWTLGAAAAGAPQTREGDAAVCEAAAERRAPNAKEHIAAASEGVAAGVTAVGGRGVEYRERKEEQQEEEEEEEAAGAAVKEEEDDRGPSRLKFPTYEEFLKEEEEAERQEEAAAEDGSQASAAEVDAAFELFMNEVKDMPTSNSKAGRGRAAAAKQHHKTATFKTAEEECVRLTVQVFPSPFQVLLLGPDATEDDIRRQYRKLSLLIHPDKCKHPNAHEAFQVVNKAYEQLQQPEMREKYREVIEEAKRRVIKERVKENRKRKMQGGNAMLLSEDPADLQQEITDMCEKLLQDAKERKEYAERTRQANERYEREQQEKLEKEELEKCRERKAFLDQREERVEGWRQFQQAIHSKDVKLQAFTGVKHQREQRKEDDLIRKRQKMQGVDTSYKDSWR